MKTTPNSLLSLNPFVMPREPSPLLANAPDWDPFEGPPEPLRTPEEAKIEAGHTFVFDMDQTPGDATRAPAISD
jgi:hypothetical protein